MTETQLMVLGLNYTQPLPSKSIDFLEKKFGFFYCVYMMHFILVK